MVASTVNGVAITGLVACVPDRREDTAALAQRFGIDTAERIARATGIDARRLAGPAVCTSDLGAAAAARLMDRLGWEPASIDLLVTVTQTHDHIFPTSGFLLHGRLGLPKAAVVLDLSLGCSGYVHGLWTAATMLNAAGGRRALLVVGDTTSRVLDPTDRSVAPLFGDAAAATALEVVPGCGPMSFAMGSDGKGAPYLCVPGGGLRHPDQPAHLFMDGTQVFAFTLREVPGSLRAALAGAGWSMPDIDHLVLHQANAQMIRHLAQKVGATDAQTVVALAEYGNTSSASIPLALASALAEPLSTSSRRLLLSGFGVGWSWGSVALEAGPLGHCAVVPFVSGEPSANPAEAAKGADVAAKFADR